MTLKNVIHFQYREKKSGKDVRLKDEAENGVKEYPNGKSEATKKAAAVQPNRRMRAAGGKKATSQVRENKNTVTIWIPDC